MASFPTQDQVNDLVVKKFQGAPFTDTTQSVTLEAIGSSSNKIISSNICSQPVPIPAPPKGTGTVIETGGKRYVSSDPNYPYIVYYENVVLKERNPQIAFYYAGTDRNNVVETNILINAIPFNYDSDGSYDLIVTNSADPSHKSLAIDGDDPWYFDGNSGYLTFYKPIDFIPAISFWRYEGKMGLEQSMGIAEKDIIPTGDYQINIGSEEHHFGNVYAKKGYFEDTTIEEDIVPRGNYQIDIGSGQHHF
jgi:hypothetical protein